MVRDGYGRQATTVARLTLCVQIKASEKKEAGFQSDWEKKLSSMMDH